MGKKLQPFTSLAEAFSKLLFPIAEVVIHDIEKDEIVLIYNPISKRGVGDKSYLKRWDFTQDAKNDLIGPYEKLNYDGRILKSISLVLKNASNKAVGFLCVNMDISTFQRHQELLSSFLSVNNDKLTSKVQSLFKDDLYEQINHYIQDYCRARQMSISRLPPNIKKELIMTLKKEGAFKGKNATNYIARILNISRATVYNYLKKE